MSQSGYTSCSGCGRLFSNRSVAEQTVLDTHDCSWSDERLDHEILHALTKQTKETTDAKNA